MRGYESNSAANRSAFTNGWFRTGDQGYLDHEGYLFLTGRLKEMINRGGEKIAPREIDDVLMLHPAIAQAIAFALPHPTLGEDLAAAIVLKEGLAVTEREIRHYVAARLADFKVPTRVLIVDRIPSGPTGKIQRITLAEQLRDRLNPSAPVLGAEAPRTAVESALVDIWKNLLSIDRVGLHDSFYMLGGDSLSLASMMIEIEARFGREISLDSFLACPTIDAVARLLVTTPDMSTAPPSVAPGRRMRPLRDSLLGGLKNRTLQWLALYAPGYRTSRVWLHRLRGVSIGKNVSIGLSALIETAYPGLVSIGNNVSIGMRTMIIAHLRESTAYAAAAHEPTVRIEDDVYIGPGVIILPHVTIGRGAVVSAGSVVSRSIPAATLARGNPARPIALCGVSLGGGVSYEEFLRHLNPIGKESCS
jgi:acetyltransferase-like isoleucine patch superfamily enzyme/acyl carrier protein